jgi:peroxiredoxin
MNFRIAVILLAIGVPSFTEVSAVRASDRGPVSAGIGRTITDFSLPDNNQKTVTLNQFRDKKAVVVLFMGTECVINNAYMPRIVDLQKEYGSRSVQFIGINSNLQDSAEMITEHVKQFGVNFPVLKDEGNVVADQFSAERTPEVFVLDAQHVIRYRGRIDDQFGIGFKRGKPTQQDLVLALNELLAGKPISRPTSPVAGCIIGRVSKPKGDGVVTYAKHIVPIIQAKCQECHRPGDVAPMSLLTYKDAVAWAGMIREVLSDGRMPPWHADARYGHFANDRSLTKQDRNTLLAWLDQGTPKGDENDMPPPRNFVKGWRIGQPDAVFEMPEAYEVPADMPKGGLPYQRFRVHTNFQEDRWVERAETRPGVPAVVHHIIIWVVQEGEDFQPGSPGMQLLCGTAPGDMPQILPRGMGKKVPAHADLIFELHYTPNGTAQKDRSRVGIIFAREEPKYVVRTLPIANDDFRIPAGADNYAVDQWFKFQNDCLLLGFMPHLHLRGKDFLYDVTYPDGKEEVLLSIPRYDFNWQSAYREAEPLFMPKGSKMHCRAHYDNSSKNPNNPDPTIPVSWGDQTWEEMMIGWIDYAIVRKDKAVSRLPTDLQLPIATKEASGDR